MDEPCHLLRLPRELRDEIYSSLFNSTHLSYRRRDTSKAAIKASVYITHTTNTLALLRTCRQINAETRDTWIKRVTFVFDDQHAAIQKLASLPTTTVSQIRKVLMFDNGISWHLYDTNQGTWPNTLLLSMFISFIPGIHLDTLTIFDDRSRQPTMNLLQSWSTLSSGWRTLRFIRPDLECLYVGENAARYRSIVQTAERYDTDVRAFLARTPSVPGCSMTYTACEHVPILRADAREEVTAVGITALSQATFDGLAYDDHMPIEMWYRAVLFVVKRRERENGDVRSGNRAHAQGKTVEKPTFSSFTTEKSSQALNKYLADPESFFEEAAVARRSAGEFSEYIEM
ncbi:hypothetical protein P280DRAFT_549718 [Massarina eburnea CBS 473.64]|uniref:F-box domain-containing protein n=1 Tax=Massarina eburnea CBS 473.64 TaxID=1395130 RepID=A0A6A6S465_9PLEO|nr:hypothetical protein P280DRAFT_549718 [Massarina eburnea CBS 473.64]